MKFELPFPVTGSGRSQKRQNYIRQARKELAGAYRRAPLYGDLGVKIRFTPPDDTQSEQRRDIDNLLKPVFDALKGIVVYDDSQIKSVVAEIMVPRGAGEVRGEVFPKKVQRFKGSRVQGRGRGCADEQPREARDGRNDE